ncbi:MAG: hypothetical protein AAFY41_13175, partial [Bacteroidota bacterium]
VEHFVQCDFAFVASLGCFQVRTDMLLELLFCYTGWDSAHGLLPLERFLTTLHYLRFLQKVESVHLQGNDLRSLPPNIHRLKRLGTSENCRNYDPQGLGIDQTLLDTLPDEVAEGGTLAILNYLENRALWHTRRLVISSASAVGGIVLLILGLRWQYRRRRKPKQKREMKG